MSKAKKLNKLNSMRYLEQHGISYEVIEFADSIHDAVEVARVAGVPEAMVYKTLVVDTGEAGKPLLALIASHQRLDLKKLAKAAGIKKLSMATHHDAEKWTSLKTGGISPLALVHKNWRVFIDQPVTQLEKFMLSAGAAGCQSARADTGIFARGQANGSGDYGCGE